MSSPTSVIAVYWTIADESPSCILSKKLFSLLDDEESTRACRFKTQELAANYVAAHALLRISLSHHADVAPQDWRFSRNRYGRPELASALRHKKLSFSLTHAHTFSMCAVAYDIRIGLDAEPTNMNYDSDLIAAKSLTDAEKEILSNIVDPVEKRMMILRRWVAKEAYLKAIGRGLSVDPSRIGFCGDGASLRLSSAASARMWRMHILYPAQGYFATLAVRKRNGHEAEVTLTHLSLPN